MPALAGLQPVCKGSNSSNSSQPSEKQWDDRPHTLQKPAIASRSRPPLGLSSLKSSNEPTEKPPKAMKIMGSLSQAMRAIKLNDTANHNDYAGYHHQKHHIERAVAQPGIIYDSSGSVHEPGTVCLAAMVNEFIEDIGSCGRARCNCGNGTHLCLASDHPDDDDNLDDYDQLNEILEEMASCIDKGESRVLKDVIKAVDSMQEKRVDMDSDCVRKGEICRNDYFLYWVMKQLRSFGYNAAVCKSRWEHAGALPAGNYEYIDVICSNERIIVDTNFRAQFEIARASEQYNVLLEMVPCTFVGKAERLHTILKTMSEGAKLSLKVMGMHLPPWRKHSYLQAKWFSSYKRTIKEIQPSLTPSITYDCLDGELHTRINKDNNFGPGANIAFKGPFFSTQFKEEVEGFYGKHRLAHPSRSSSVALHGDEITVISTGWEPPALNPARLALNRSARRRVSALADALRQQPQTNPLEKQSHRLNLGPVVC